MSSAFNTLIALFNTWPPLSMALLELIVCLTLLFSLLRGYGLYGLYCFICISLIAANIQVLKGGQFIFPKHPIAMGTLLFGIITFGFDVITEYYGKAAALKGVQLGFICLTFFTILMWLTVGVAPLDPAALAPDAMALYENHLHLKALFMPMPGILAASLISYYVSQYVDVLVFWLLKHFTHARWLGLRTMVAASLAALLDTCLFSLLAWKVFNPNPVSWQTLVSVYIVGTYPLRLLCSFGLSPFIYLARSCLPQQK